MIEKEVCRLKISESQLLFNLGPEHFGSLVNKRELLAVYTRLGWVFFFFLSSPSWQETVKWFILSDFLVGAGNMHEIPNGVFIIFKI